MKNYLRRLAALLSRAMLVAGRNLTVQRSRHRNWIGYAAGFLEPLFYLMSVTIGLGRLVGNVAEPGRTPVSYAVFVAPAMLGASVMNGVLVEANFNFFRKLRLSRLYEAVLATPVGAVEIALGELFWAVLRGSIYSAVFLMVMVGLDYTTPGRALAAVPVTILIGLSFGAFGMTLSTFVKSLRSFEIISTIQFALFLFSGTFIPVTAYPPAARWLVELSPLQHAVSLLRGITTGSLGAYQVVNAVVLLCTLVAGLALISRRVAHILYE